VWILWHTLAALLLLISSGAAHAHGIAGNRFFVGTLTFDDPAVADEAILPAEWFTSWDRLSGRLRRLQSEPRLDRLAHHEFLNLAGDGHREFVDEFHVPRNFVMRDLSLTETANLLSGQRLP
jgi:hypothetical protein